MFVVLSLFGAFLISYFLLSCVVRFHIAHLYEVQGKYKVAKDSYETLLKEKDLPVHLRADICRQLGTSSIHYRHVRCWNR